MLGSAKSLMAIAWVGATIASPLDLVAPQSAPGTELEARVDGCGNYESKNGLNFTVYCEINNPFNDAFSPAKPDVANKEDCMELCSRYWGNGEGCFGMVFVAATNECWIRNSNTSTDNFVQKEGHFSALLTDRATEMTGYSTACPNTDGSVNTLSGVDGLKYTTNCGKVINGQDACFSGYSCEDQPYYGFHHTETMEECLRICVDSSPLCRAVSWNPGLQIGFANCWLKTGFPADSIVDPRSNMGVLHSATITQIDPVDRNCPSDKFYSASNKNFEIHCGQLNEGSNITSVHTQNVTACMDACAASDQSCVGVLFDSTLVGGFNNCYLQSTTGFISDQANSIYAVLSNTVLPSSSASAGSGSGSGSGLGSSGSGGNSSSSKAWIAGPVVGGLAGLAIIGAAIFFWRRRKSNNAATGGGMHGPIEKYGGAGGSAPAGYGPAPAYSPGGHPNGPVADFHGMSPQQQHGQQQYYDAPASEMDGRMTNELPASTKYAHEAKRPAVELA